MATGDEKDTTDIVFSTRMRDIDHKLSAFHKLRNFMIWLISILGVVIIAAAITFAIVGKKNVWERLAGPADLGPFQIETLQRSKTPKDGLICSPELCGSLRADAGVRKVFDQTPAQLIAQIEDALQSMDLDYVVVSDGADPTTLRFVTWTKIWGFPDTNQFWAMELPDGKTGLIAYARAQLGQSDLGNNRKRLLSIVDSLEGQAR